MWLCLGDIALLSVLTIILCVRLAKHLRRAKTGEEFYSEDLGSSNYGVPTRLFHKFPKLNRKRFTMPWYVVIIIMKGLTKFGPLRDLLFGSDFS